MNIIKIVNDKLRVDEIADLVKTPTCGAVTIFIGTTRNNFNNLEVETLFYEAYEPMAVKIIDTICSHIREKWPSIVNIAIFHRLGKVDIGEESVIIGISSPHREESLAAINYAISSLKATVPIWKKEIYKNNVEPEWKENKECEWSKK